MFHVARDLPGLGLGLKFRKGWWPEDCYYLLTRVAPEWNLKSGEFRGRLVWKGQQHDKDKAITKTSR